jgi:hypothetical protein
MSRRNLPFTLGAVLLTGAMAGAHHRRHAQRWRHGAAGRSCGAIGLGVSFMSTPSRRDRVCEPERSEGWETARLRLSLALVVPSFGEAAFALCGLPSRSSLVG